MKSNTILEKLVEREKTISEATREYFGSTGREVRKKVPSREGYESATSFSKSVPYSEFTDVVGSKP